MRCFVNPAKFAAAGILSLFFGFFSAFYYMDHRLVEAIVFTALFLLFFYLTVRNGSLLTIQEEGISLAFLGLSRKELSWNEIQEIGIIGERVLNRRNKKKTGTLYIYFSDRPFTDEERFQLGLTWPPKRIPYTTFSEEKIHRIQYYWGGRISTYNIGNLTLS